MGGTHHWPRCFTSVRVTGGGVDPGPGGLNGGHVSLKSLPTCVCDVRERVGVFLTPAAFTHRARFSQRTPVSDGARRPRRCSRPLLLPLVVVLLSSG